MRNGLAAGPLASNLPYADAINWACSHAGHGGIEGFSPLVAYACATNETIQGQLNGSWNAATVVSEDGGHGLFQLTSSFPPVWQNPYINAMWACEHFLIPAEVFWTQPEFALSGDDLVRAVAASFNAGLGGALNGHREGDVDKFTTDHYGARALAHYLALVEGKSPFT